MHFSHFGLDRRDNIKVSPIHSSACKCLCCLLERCFLCHGQWILLTGSYWHDFHIVSMKEEWYINISIFTSMRSPRMGQVSPTCTFGGLSVGLGVIGIIS